MHTVSYYAGMLDLSQSQALHAQKLLIMLALQCHGHTKKSPQSPKHFRTFWQLRHLYAGPIAFCNTTLFFYKRCCIKKKHVRPCITFYSIYNIWYACYAPCLSSVHALLITYSYMSDCYICTTGLLILHYWTTFGLSCYLDT